MRDAALSILRAPATLASMKLVSRLGMLLILFYALAVCPARAQDSASIKIVARETLPAEQIYLGDPPHKTTRELALTLVYFSGGDWPHETILGVVRGAGMLLAQCAILVPRIEFVRTDAPKRYHYFGTAVSRELARILNLAKPTVYFVTDTRQQPAFDAEAIGRGNSKSRPELADTVWVTRTTRDPGIALAHELIHVLTNSGEHVDIPGNLMRDETTPENIDLTITQCAQIRDIGTQNGLLRETVTGDR